MKVKTGDAFIVFRLKALEEEGKLVIAGDWNKGWKVVGLPRGTCLPV